MKYSDEQIKKYNDNKDDPNNAKRANKDIAMSISIKDKPFIGRKPL